MLTRQSFEGSRSPRNQRPADASVPAPPGDSPRGRTSTTFSRRLGSIGLILACVLATRSAVSMADEDRLVVADVRPTSWLPAGDLPSDGGQVMQDYDISAFVEQAGVGSQKLVVDWVLQDTGYTAWHGAVVASLSADDKRLRCFHVPEMHARVAEIVKRFCGDAQAPHRFGVRLLGLGSPSWRSGVGAALEPIPAATPGISVWITPREQAVAILANLRRRGDCRELPTGVVFAANGQPAVIAGGRKLSYVRDVAATPQTWPGWQTLQGACDEGIALDVHPLISADGNSIEAVVRCRIDQVEQLTPVVVGSPTADRSRVQIEVPQFSSLRVGERFAWPVSHVLVIGLGLVPWPVPEGNGPGPKGFGSDPVRRDLVLFVEPRLASSP